MSNSSNPLFAYYTQENARIRAERAAMVAEAHARGISLAQLERERREAERAAERADAERLPAEQAQAEQDAQLAGEHADRLMRWVSYVAAHPQSYDASGAAKPPYDPTKPPEWFV